MPFGHAARPTRAYAYHAVLLAGGDAVHAELRRRAALWNALVEIDHDLRERKEAIADAAVGIDQAAHDARRERIADLWRQGTAQSKAEAAALERQARTARRPAWRSSAARALARCQAAVTGAVILTISVSSSSWPGPFRPHLNIPD